MGRPEFRFPFPGVVWGAGSRAWLCYNEAASPGPRGFAHADGRRILCVQRHIGIETSRCRGKVGSHTCVPGAPSPHSFLPPKVFPHLGCLDVADKDSQRCVWGPVCPRRSSGAEIPSGRQGCVDFRPRDWRLSGVTLPFPSDGSQLH